MYACKLVSNPYRTGVNYRLKVLVPLQSGQPFCIAHVAWDVETADACLKGFKDWINSRNYPVLHPLPAGNHQQVWAALEASKPKQAMQMTSLRHPLVRHLHV